jgi:hypothetical protein
LNQQSCPSGQGYSTTAGCVAGTVVTESLIYGSSSAKQFVGTFTVSNSTQYKLMLKYAGKCDPYWVSPFGSGFNFGSYSCDSWLNGSALIIDAYSSTSRVNVRIRAGGNWTTGYSIQELSQRAIVKSSNDSAGVTIIGVDYNDQDVGLRVISQSQTLDSSSMDVTVYFQGTAIGSASLTKY